MLQVNDLWKTPTDFKELEQFIEGGHYGAEKAAVWNAVMMTVNLCTKLAQEGHYDSVEAN